LLKIISPFSLVFGHRADEEAIRDRYVRWPELGLQDIVQGTIINVATFIATMSPLVMGSTANNPSRESGCPEPWPWVKYTRAWS